MVYNLKMQCCKECPTYKNCNAKAWQANQMSARNRWSTRPNLRWRFTQPPISFGHGRPSRSYYSVLPSPGKHRPPPPPSIIIRFDELTLWIIVSRTEHLSCSYCYSFHMSIWMTMAAIRVATWLLIRYCVSGGGCTRCKPSPTLPPFFFFRMELWLINDQYFIFICDFVSAMPEE
jgi:hypothetical protein